MRAAQRVKRRKAQFPPQNQGVSGSCANRKRPFHYCNLRRRELMVFAYQRFGLGVVTFELKILS
jgi:hypothetical protein